MGKWMYKSKFSWPRCYLEVSVQLHALAALPSGRSRLWPLDRRLGGRKTWRKVISSPNRDSNFDTSVIKPVGSRYTDCVIPPPEGSRSIVKYKWLSPQSGLNCSRLYFAHFDLQWSQTKAVCISHLPNSDAPHFVTGSETRDVSEMNLLQQNSATSETALMSCTMVNRKEFLASSTNRLTSCGSMRAVIGISEC
jgi:hypothetical protein